MVDVVVIGSVTIDLTTYVRNRVPNYGYSAVADDFRMDFGGKGANLAVMCRLLGSKVLMIGKVGDDEFGCNYREHLEKLGVCTDGLSVSTTKKTGAAQVFVNQVIGEYSATVYTGANGQLSIEDVRRVQPIIASAKCLIVSILAPFCAALEALRIAKQNGLITVLNPAPAHFATRMRLQQSDYNEFLRLSDFICPNLQEAAALVGDLDSAENLRQCCDPAVLRQGAEQILRQLHAELCHVGNSTATVIATLGGCGVAFWNSETSGIEFVEVEPVRALDTTGAGDCFTGSLVHYLVHYKSLSLREKIRRASKIASVSVTKLGTQCSYPKKHELPVELFM